MKRIFPLIFLILLLTLSISFAESSPVDLTALTASELTTFIEDINAALEKHHEPDSTAREISLNTTKKYVESHFKKQGIDISWAWFNYTYTKDWDFYTVSTHIDYEDANEKSHTDDVYAELFPEKGKHAIYYLLVGTEVLINRRDELPERRWTDPPASITNSATNTELATFTRDELKSLKRSVEKEYSDHHEPEYSTSNLVLSLTKAAVDQHLGSQGFTVSWAWFDYTYTREWDFYTLTTPITYRNENTSHKSTVYAEAYPQSSQYALVYLSIDDDVLLDKRDQVPSVLSSSSSPTSPVSTISESTPTPELTSAQFETVILDSQGNEMVFLSDAPAMTVENSDEFAKVLSVKNPADPIVERFADKHSADLIEFDGHIAYMGLHENYNTRYDILLYAGDYNGKGTSGPNFQFVDVNIADLGLSGLFMSDVLKVNDNVHIIALVDQYNSKTELFKLVPLQVTVRTPTPNTPAYETLKPGSKGQAVLDARMKLYELGYFRKKPTQTEYTNNMMDYVKKFEKDYGLMQDGILSPEDLTVLYNACK